MTEFNIDQYEISVTVDEQNGSDDNSTDECQLRSTDEQLIAHEQSVQQEDDDAESNDAVTQSDSSEPSLVQVPLRPVSHPPKRSLAKPGELFCRWIFYHLYHHRNLQPEKIALIEEVSEARCVSYGELVDGAIRTANYMNHHGVESGDRVAMCMENSVEYVFYQLGCYLLGAVPVLINPSHIASDKLEPIECRAAVVDIEHYGHMLRASKSYITGIEHMFVLSEELSAIYIPSHVWIYDGFGFLTFPTNFKRSMPMKDAANCVFTTSGINEPKPRYVSHSSESSQQICLNYYDKLFDLLVEKDPDYTSINGHHLITNGLHCIESWSYLLYVLIKGETCVISESTQDVWRPSYLDRIAGLIEQYNIPLIMTNAQMLKCFIKYEVHNIYNLTSLKVIANSGTCVSSSVAKTIKEILNVSVTQAYSAAEFGVIAFEMFDDARDEQIISCGLAFDKMQVKIADIESEREVDVGEWGHVIMSGPQLFSGYVGQKCTNDAIIKKWFKTGDYGMIDEKRRVHIGGPVCQLLEARQKKISPSLIENVLCQHKKVEEAVVVNNGYELWSGIVVPEGSDAPNTDNLDNILKKHQILANISKIVRLECIPMSENGKILRNEIGFLMKMEPDEAVLLDRNESYI